MGPRNMDREAVEETPPVNDGGVALEMNGHTTQEGFVEVDIGGNYEPKDSIAEHEDEVIIKTKEEKPKMKMVGTFEIFKYADKVDVMLMVVGTIASLAFGLGIPAFLLIYGEMIDALLADDFTKKLNMTAGNLTVDPSSAYAGHVATELTVMMRKYLKFFIGMGFGMMFVGFIAVWMWVWTSERQTVKIRKLFYQSVMRQDIGWFDQQQVGELTTRLADDINNIHNGIGDKVAIFLHHFASFLTGYFVGFSRGWLLTLVIISLTPLVAISIGVVTVLMRKLTVGEQAAYGGAGAIAEEVLSAIRTVVAFGGQKKEVERYSRNLGGARSLGIKKGLVSGVGVGFIQLVIFSSFSLAFWYGSQLSMNPDSGYSGGRVLQVFLGVLIGSMSLGNAAPNLETFATARGSAAKVFEIIERKSKIDSSCTKGEKPNKIEGKVQFENIEFSYPTRPEVQVLDGLSFEINVGQTVALVGASGCGKSTTAQLLQRFYDPPTGRVKIGGYDIKDLNVKFMREMIGVVSQEPVLFATTIAENIRYGRDGITQEEVEQAAKEANAHDFICKLPDRYETLVGERGTQLSGGQKQRVAIARALVRNPKILILDEATSALDMESESIVQDALDKAGKGRTTLIIAHRLSTIKTADMIVGIENGKVVEQGSHEQLMNMQGLYYELVMNQTKGHDQDDDDVEDLEAPLLDKGGFQRAASAHLSRRSSRNFTRQESTMSGVSVWSDKDEVKAAEKLPKASVKRILRMNSPEIPYIIGGSISGVFVGSINPIFAVILSEVLGNFAQPDYDKQAKTAAMMAGAMTGAAAIVFFCQIAMNFFFAVAGENLTLRLRKLSFAAMLRQEISYFDQVQNQVGALTARLATDASDVKGAAGPQAGLITQSLGGLGCAIIIAFVFGWKLAFVVSVFLPIIVLSGLVQATMQRGVTQRNTEALEEGAKLATESIENIRTVAALNKEDHFMEKYNAHFDAVYIKGRRQAIFFGFFFGLAQSIVYFIYAATYGYGAVLIDNGEMEFKNVFRVFSALFFGGIALGRASSLAPDYSKAITAASKVFALLDRTPSIDSSSDKGMKLKSFEGNIKFEGVKFRYPSRPDQVVLRGLDADIKKGQTVALVGTSGCGKSTSIQLIERFYDADNGCVKFDGENLKSINVSWLRQQLGLVSQEPVLFDLSIRENIAYGDNSRDVSIEEVIEAAKKANIHNFISNLPKGYETNVGEKGAQLSGGQKQRIAIARALIRNPQILLLDEATSALDTESEKVVQEALDQAMTGRTSIVIAHRLSTIRNADKIIVMKQGCVVETGTHAELMAAEGMYFKLIQVQNRRRPSISN